MSAETSTATGSYYGLERVCRVLEFPRSTIYAKRAAESRSVIALRPKRRGPKPKISDERLLEAIRADLATSPFVGEGVTASPGRGCAWRAFASRVRACCG